MHALALLLLGFIVLSAAQLPMSICTQAAQNAQHYASCGCPYVWGGTQCGCGGSGGMDCSGLCYTSYIQAGWKDILRTAAQQYTQGGSCNPGCSPSNPSACTVGDQFFYCFSQPCPDHVVMYIGNNQAAECPHTGEDCHVITPYSDSYQGCRSHCSGNSASASSGSGPAASSGSQSSGGSSQSSGGSSQSSGGSSQSSGGSSSGGSSSGGSSSGGSSSGGSSSGGSSSAGSSSGGSSSGGSSSGGSSSGGSSSGGSSSGSSSSGGNAVPLQKGPKYHRRARN